MREDGSKVIHRWEVNGLPWFIERRDEGDFVVPPVNEAFPVSGNWSEFLRLTELVGDLSTAIHRIGDPKMWRRQNGDLVWYGETPGGNEIETEDPRSIAAQALAATGELGK